jgi:hypothetical protein
VNKKDPARSAALGPSARVRAWLWRR